MKPTDERAKGQISFLVPSLGLIVVAQLEPPLPLSYPKTCSSQPCISIAAQCQLRSQPTLDLCFTPPVSCPHDGSKPRMARATEHPWGQHKGESTVLCCLHDQHRCRLGGHDICSGFSFPCPRIEESHTSHMLLTANQLATKFISCGQEYVLQWGRDEAVFVIYPPSDNSSQVMFLNCIWMVSYLVVTFQQLDLHVTMIDSTQSSLHTNIRFFCRLQFVCIIELRLFPSMLRRIYCPHSERFGA